MARPRNADGQRTRKAILDAALDLFSEKGYFGTSLRDVATAVGVRESALYNYFAGNPMETRAFVAVSPVGNPGQCDPAAGTGWDAPTLAGPLRTINLGGFPAPFAVRP